MSKQYNFPVYGTQGGGLVREVNGAFIFIEKPDCPGLDVGDVMPQEWGIVAANDLALRESDRDHGMEAGFDEFFELAFKMKECGEISLETIGGFFPEVVKARNTRFSGSTS